MKPTRYLSVKEVAEILNISSKTVYRKLRIIPGYFNLGGIHFFDEEEFRNGLKQLATDTNRNTSVSQPRKKDIHGLLT
ncbi:MAG: helix-turn-helix domain-containing protein [Ignavibacteria bacterium]|nr:helix-turn-helix domain-containing protein [Ignavibacteria bacterium]